MSCEECKVPDFICASFTDCVKCLWPFIEEHFKENPVTKSEKHMSIGGMDFDLSTVYKVGPLIYLEPDDLESRYLIFFDDGKQCCVYEKVDTDKSHRDCFSVMPRDEFVKRWKMARFGVA